jgi:hypothetical protein
MIWIQNLLNKISQKETAVIAPYGPPEGDKAEFFLFVKRADAIDQKILREKIRIQFSLNNEA